MDGWGGNPFRVRVCVAVAVACGVVVLAEGLGFLVVVGEYCPVSGRKLVPRSSLHRYWLVDFFTDGALSWMGTSNADAVTWPRGWQTMSVVDAGNVSGFGNLERVRGRSLGKSGEICFFLSWEHGLRP